MTSALQSGKLTFPILLVEDDLAIVDIIHRAAKSSFPEADFISINTFDEAVVYLYNLEGKGPNLILLDVFLPGAHTGLDFLNLLKIHPLGKLLPAIILSQSENQKHVKEAYLLGATSYFVKPFTFLDWKNFLFNLRLFWYETATLPRTYFEKQQEILR
ncbi:response regulator [Spirosoma sp. HMF4905]|uniref:Response regulator n=1 Tax=Spirosoma arboris TaxID=2682092 RepID=A0A7K1SHV7_9BACT|nr:response regulator [Spirosoma arboris]MVM33407.1 response regulator [Spirosoma arboris]